MFKLIYPLPEKYWVAVSGGVDSMSVLHWLSRSGTDRLLGVVHVNHGTAHAQEAEKFVTEHCKNLHKFSVVGHPQSGKSKEEWWRERRYELFDQLPGNAPVILAHHMGDCLEEYLMCVLSRGYMGSIPYARGRCIRPFRLWKKQDILSYARRHGVKWIEDPSNQDTKYKRNFIRNELVGKVLGVNPGIYRLVEQAIIKQDEFDRLNYEQNSNHFCTGP